MKGKQTVVAAMAQMIVIAIACCALQPAAASQQAICVPADPIDPIEFVQLTTMQLDAGIETYEAFRILSTGRLEWARWTSDGYLLDHSEFHDGGRELFERVLSARSILKRSPRSWDGVTILGRMGSMIEIATLSKSGTQISKVEKIPDDIVALIDDLRRVVTPTSVLPGWYVWTEPYALSWFDKPDVNLVHIECNFAVTMALAEALETGQLIVRADDGIQAFINENRGAYTAKLARGALLFGIAYAR